MLVTSIFSFSCNVFYPSQKKFQFLNSVFFFFAEIKPALCIFHIVGYSIRQILPLDQCNGYTGISLYVGLFACLSEYKILVILYHELLQFCFSCIEILHIHWPCIEVLRDTIQKCQLLLVEELSPLELILFIYFFFFITCFCWSSGRGIKSYLVTALV